MARTRAAKPAITPAKPKASSSDDPLDWLYLNPEQDGFVPEPGFAYGVLRRSYHGRTNSAGEFCRRKAQPVAPVGDAEAVPWALTAERVEVLLPDHADDRLLDPRLLCELVDVPVASDQSLLTYVTVTFQEPARLHGCWEQVRSFARSCFVYDRHLPVILILHAPHRAGSDHPVHCHLLIVPRRLDGLGLRGFEQSFVRDEGQAIIHAEWLAHKAAWV